MTPDTADWHLACFLQWRPKRKPTTIDCSYCHGNGEVGGGFKSLDGPRPCPECFGSRVKTTYPDLAPEPAIPEGLQAHMLAAYQAFFAALTNAAPQAPSERSGVDTARPDGDKA